MTHEIGEPDALHRGEEPARHHARPPREEALLADVGVALTRGVHLREMLETCAEVLVTHLHVAVARIWIYDDKDQTLQLEASVGREKLTERDHCRAPAREIGIGRIAIERKPHLTNDAASDSCVDDRDWAIREGLSSFAGYPLLIGDRILGVLALYARRDLAANTLETLKAVAGSLALGIQRLRAEADGRQQQDVLEIVNNVGRLLSAELDLQKLVQAITDAATDLAKAAFGAFFYNVEDESGGKYLLYTLSGAPREAFERFPIPRATELFGPTFTGAGPVRLQDVTEDPRYGKNPPHHGMPGGHLPVVSYLAVPVVSRSGEVLGGLFLGHPVAGRFTEREEKLVAGLAAQAAVAIDNARLFEEVGRQRSDAAAEEKRQRFLAEASAKLASSLDYETTLAAVARLAVPTLADWCFVDVVTGEGLRRVAVVAADPGRAALVERLSCSVIGPALASSENAPSGGPSGDPLLVPEITPESMVPAEHEAIRELAPRSLLVMPLMAHGCRLGVITWIFTDESGRRYRQSDIPLAEELTRRAGQAVENARLYGDLQEANRIKEDFLATLSHELRTPLTAIIGWTQLLREDRLDPPTACKALEAISRNAQRQHQLISDVLDVSRIVAGKLRLETKRVDLIAVVQAALDTVRPVAESKGVALDSFLDPTAGPVWGDPARLEQVVWNLLSNAVKFVPSGGHVAVRLHPLDGHIEITVTDDGPGIDGAFLPHVFERFRQADGSSTRAHHGLGLGLAIVRHMVELHGGTVEAANRTSGTGAILTVTLPRTSVDSWAEGHSRDLAFELPAWMEPAPSLSGVEVLVVDDEADSRDVMSTTLRLCGARVTTAATAREGLRLVEREHPTVLLIDIEMPGEDGYELLRRIRELPPERGGGAPAAAVTAYASTDDRLKALRAGFQVHMPKPVKPIELAKLVASLAGRGGSTL